MRRMLLGSRVRGRQELKRLRVQRSKAYLFDPNTYSFRGEALKLRVRIYVEYTGDPTIAPHIVHFKGNPIVEP